MTNLELALRCWPIVAAFVCALVIGAVAAWRVTRKGIDK
jgi:hypothetical protein